MPLGGNNWIGLLVWSLQMRLLKRLHSHLYSLVSLSRWLELGALFRSRWVYELASLLWQGSRMVPRIYKVHCLGTQISSEFELNSLDK